MQVNTSHASYRKHSDHAQYRVDDIRAPLEDALSNPRLAAYVLKSHDQSVNIIHESADTSTKRKRKRFNLAEPAEEHPEVTALQTKLDSMQLKCWPLTLDSALFMRGPKYTDHNPFTQPVRYPSPLESIVPNPFCSETVC